MHVSICKEAILLRWGEYEVSSLNWGVKHKSPCQNESWTEFDQSSYATYVIESNEVVPRTINDKVNWNREWGRRILRKRLFDFIGSKSQGY
jgi:hypothetical protein